MGHAEQTEALRRLARREGGTFILGDNTFRMRRGKLVLIPEEWVGRVAQPRTKSLRKKLRRGTSWYAGPAYGRMDREHQDKLTAIYGKEGGFYCHRRRAHRQMPPAPSTAMNKAELREQLRDMDDA